jgi:flagellar hook-associated protein 3 FlgL
MIYDLGVGAIQQQTASLVTTQQQLSLGKRMLTPADDPVAAAKLLEALQSKNLNDAYTKNIEAAQSALELEESTLGSLGAMIQDAKDAAVNAGNPTLTMANRQALAKELRGIYDSILGLANRKDGNGQYLFSGFKGATQPYSQTTGAGVYQGDQGQRLLQINASRRMEVSDTGAAVFKTGATSGADVFKVVSDLATALEGATFSQADVNAALTGLDEALGTVLNVRTSVGVRLKELDSAQSFVTDLSSQYQQIMSQLEDLDYAKAISDLTKNQVTLEAAQKSFMKVQGLSLFNYM